MTSFTRIVVSTLAAGLFALAAVPPAGAADTLAPGQPFPSLASVPLEGELPDLAGARVLIVDFWASWCAPCKASFPVYDELQKEFGAKGVRIIAVNVDKNARHMAAFLEKQPVSFAVVRDAEMKLVSQARVPTMPTSFVVDAKGVVRFVHSGFHGKETLRQYRDEIAQLLGEAP